MYACTYARIYYGMRVSLAAFQSMYVYACTYMPTCVCIQEGSEYGPTGQGVAYDFVYVLHPCRNTDIPADIHVYRHTYIHSCMRAYIQRCHTCRVMWWLV